MKSNLQTVFCIDDEQDILKIAQFSLERVGKLTVETCNSGREGIARAAALNPDIILLDMMMPGMNGAQTFNALHDQAETQHIPVVFMTAKVQPSEVEGYKAMGVAGVIAKPFDPITLSETVATIWGEFHAAERNKNTA